MDQDIIEAAAAAVAKRPRKQNWQPDETMCLALSYKDNLKMINGNFSDTNYTSKGRQEAWLSIAKNLEASFLSMDD